ncbi:MAG: multisubunit Na+/H+ antiporter MnhB subunit [Candidatus Aldehydirespiratoraceae bacterium]|jgi:multisubunit Na+/H+ antiporter MnhB subunit
MIGSRSPIVRVGVRAATPLALMVGTYLLFAGHNNPGGGFAAGLVYSAVITLRTVAGMQRPTHATGLITGGIVVVCLVALAPLLWGNTFLDQEIVSTTLPFLGKVKTGTALPFDIGVTAIVVGLVVALLDGLDASELDKPNHTRQGVDQ